MLPTAANGDQGLPANTASGVGGEAAVASSDRPQASGAFRRGRTPYTSPMGKEFNSQEKGLSSDFKPLLQSLEAEPFCSG